jgi:CheY-like chemotaxis protein
MKLRADARLHRQSVRVLVVDDYPDNAESMGMLLRLLGHEVATAHDGTAALQAARVRQPDVVLLDISMPKMNGYEVARQLRGLLDPRLEHVRGPSSRRLTRPILRCCNSSKSLDRPLTVRPSRSNRQIIIRFTLPANTSAQTVPSPAVPTSCQ